MLPNPTISTKLLTNTAYGFPRGLERRVRPIALACLHITANPNTPPATAAQERDYANRTGSDGPSAHFYLARTGPAVQAIDWQKYAAWSNGDVNSPKLSVPGVQAVVDLRASGKNANEAYWLELEQCGRNPAYPITESQISTAAFLIAKAAQFSDLPIERRTVHLHSDLNSIDRASCPVPASQAEDYVDGVISLARDYLQVLDLQGEVDALNAQVATLLAANGSAQITIDRLNTIVAAQAETLDLQAQKLREWAAYSDAVKSDAGSILALDPPA